MFCWFLLYDFRFLDGISVEVLVQDRFVCSIQCCVPLSLPEYHIGGAVKRLGQWVVYEVLLGRYAVPTEYAGSDPVIQRLSVLFRNFDESQASAHTGMLQRWPPPRPGLVRRLTNHRACRSVVLELDRH